MRTAAQAAVLVGAVTGSAASVALLTFTVGSVGAALYGGARVDWPLVAIALAVAAALRAAAGVLGTSFGAARGAAYRRRALLSALRASPDAVRLSGPGAALSTALDVESVGDFFAHGVTGLVLGLVEIAAAILIVASYPALEPLILPLVLSLVVPAVLAALLVVRRRRWRTVRLALVGRTIGEMLGLETRRVLGGAPDEEADERMILAAYSRRAASMDAAAVALTAIPGLVLLALLVPLISLAGASSAAWLAVGIGAAVLAVSGIERFASISFDAASAADAAQSLRSLAGGGAVSASVSSSTSTASDRASGDEAGSVLVRLTDVTATYSAGTGLVEPVTLVVREGDRLLVGAPSGFGKTTLGEIVSGERSPTTGSVWRRGGVVIARVLQADDDHMFAASILFNVAAGVEWPAGPEVRSRAEQLLVELGLGPLLRSMPAGLAQPVGEGGWRLSTGERTRVSVAAALLREPDVLILDEVVASLDGRTREMVLAACRRHSASTVLFAHVA